MVEPDHPNLSISQQCKLLSISRSSFYDTPKGETEQNLDVLIGLPRFVCQGHYENFLQGQDFDNEVLAAAHQCKRDEWFWMFQKSFPRGLDDIVAAKIVTPGLTSA